jgi:DNA helicase-2/ATP-dependent DNA helicase PcrA
MQWTPGQEAIIRQRHRNLAVYAGPGSGKTAVLIAHLAGTLRDGLKPGECMALTYTREAAREIRERLRKDRSLPLGMVDALRVGTIHAQVFRWLVTLRYPVQVLLSQREQHDLIREAIGMTGMKRAHEVASWTQRVTALHSVTLSGDVSRSERRVLAAYQRLKRRAQRWDFEDILLSFLDLLQRYPGQLRRLPLKHLWVDEFQDIDALQWAVLDGLRRVFDTPMFVVGDDDQAIYGFRGADPDWLLKFPQRVPGTSVHVLGANFRSGTQIVEVAARLIGHAAERMPKQIQARAGIDGSCKVFHWSHDTEEARSVAAMIATSRSVSDSDSVAVLARTRAQLARVWASAPSDVREHVEFRTFHEAKGREWNEVHVVGMAEPNPYLRVQDARNDEEERRLVYVAMTRARHRLAVHVPYRLWNQRCTASRFLKEAGLL